MADGFNELLEHFRQLQLKIIEHHTELERLKAEYKKQMKEHFGVADGDPIDVLKLIEFIRKVK